MPGLLREPPAAAPKYAREGQRRGRARAPKSRVTVRPQTASLAHSWVTDSEGSCGAGRGPNHTRGSRLRAEPPGSGREGGHGLPLRRWEGGLAPSRRTRLCRCVSRATAPALEPTARPAAEAPLLTSPRGCPAAAGTLLSPVETTESPGQELARCEGPAATTRTETIPSDGLPSRALPGRPGDTVPGLGSVSSEEGTGGPEDARVPAPLLQSSRRGAVCGADARAWSRPGPGAHFNDGHAEA